MHVHTHTHTDRLWSIYLNLEFTLSRKAATHDYEIQHLYEEMEQQIKKEKDRIVLQVKPV